MKSSAWVFSAILFLPVVALTFAPKLGVELPLVGQGMAIIVMSAYCSAMLAISGGIYWGAGLAHNSKGASIILVGTALALYGWSLQLPWTSYFVQGLGGPLYFYAAGFAIALILDSMFTAAGILPRWILPLRAIFHIGIIICLIISAMDAEQMFIPPAD